MDAPAKCQKHPSAMNAFLEEYPQYKKTAVLLEKIRSRSIDSELGSLEGCTGAVTVENLRDFAATKYFQQPIVRRALQGIADSEPSGPKKMVYQLLAGQQIKTGDIRTKMLFCREFPSFTSYFVGQEGNEEFKMADLLFRRIYYREDVSECAAAELDRMEAPQRLFYFMALADCLNKEYIKAFAEGLDGIYARYRYPALSYLSRAEYYGILATQLLYASPADKIKMVRGLGNTVDYEELAAALLDECFSTRIAIETVYAQFLGLITIFGLSYRYRLKLIYAWLRYFLKERLFEEFEALLLRTSAAPRLDDEYRFYEGFARYLRGEVGLDAVRQISEQLEDTNGCAKHGLGDIIDVYGGKAH